MSGNAGSSTSIMRYSIKLILITGMALSIASVAGGQSGNTSGKTTGSISGNIFVGGKAAVGIVVGAFTAENGYTAPYAQTKTDSEGRFQLTGLPPRTYQVTALTGNLVPLESNAGSPLAYGWLSNGQDILLAAGEDVSGIDLKFARGAVITGRVRDADNKPIADERISLHPVEEGPNADARPFLPMGQTYSTDDRGVYRLFGLRAGKYKISVGKNTAGGYVGSVNGFYPLTYYPDATDPSKAEIVEIAAGGEATNIDIRVGAVEETFNVSGRVVFSDTGTPVAGTEVRLITAGKSQTSSSTFSLDMTTADGRFIGRGLTSGRYGAYVSSNRGGPGVYSDPVYFDVIDKDLTSLEIKAVRGVTISGTITGENVDPKALLAQLPSLVVGAAVFPSNMQVNASTIRSFGNSQVAADGSFRIDGLRPGRAIISLSTQDDSQRPTIVRIEKDGVVSTQGLEIERGQSVSGVRIFIAFGTGVIRGTVRFEGGSPPQGYQPEVACWREGTRSFAGGSIADARGHYIITRLAPATYQCTLEMLPFGPTPTPGPPAPQKKFITVVDGMEAELNFVVSLSAKEGGP